VVGPDLKDVTKTHSIDWISKWIRGSQGMVEAKDPMAVELFTKFNMIPMPDQALSDGEIKAVLDYIKSESGGEVVADKKTEDKKADTTKAAVASDNASSGPDAPASDKKVTTAQNTTSVAVNSNSDETTPPNPDKFFLILTVGFVGLIFLGIVWALSFAINRLSKALGDVSKK